MWHKCYIIKELSYRKKMQIKNLATNQDGCLYPLCPRCKTSIERNLVKFCDKCGQKLSWRDLHKAKIN